MANLQTQILEELRMIRALLQRGSVGPSSNDPDYITPEARAEIKSLVADYKPVKRRKG